MAHNSMKQPLLTGLLDPTTESNQKVAKKRRRLRRCMSAPQVESVPGERNDTSRSSHSDSILYSTIPPSITKIALFLIVYVLIGSACFYLVKQQIKGKKTNGFLDSVYFCIVTMTTVGYGDLVPNGVTSKLLACAFVFLGMAFVGMVLSKGADYLVEKQEVLLVQALHVHQNVGTTEILREIETCKVRYKFLMALSLLVLVIVVGTIFLVAVEKLTLVDAFYCVCSTITTLGYGDKSFSTTVGRIFAVFWILIGTICVAQFFLYLAELNTESRQRALVKWVLTRKMTNVDLEAADLDDDGSVGAFEFVLFKLKEMGKINHEDISLLMEEFENLDVDQSGTLSVSDITIAQSSKLGR